MKRHPKMGCQPNKHSQIWTSLVKIQIGAKFWFKNDLSLVDYKNILEQHQEQQKKMKNNKMMRECQQRITK